MTLNYRFIKLKRSKMLLFKSSTFIIGKLKDLIKTIIYLQEVEYLADISMITF